MTSNLVINHNPTAEQIETVARDGKMTICNNPSDETLLMIEQLSDDLKTSVILYDTGSMTDQEFEHVLEQQHRLYWVRVGYFRSIKENNGVF